MDAEAVRQAVTLAKDWRDALRADWLRLMELSVWGEVKSSRMGATAKARRRLLEVGEKLCSLFADRAWIPHPREQVKNALGSAYSLKDALLQFERAAQDLDGGADYAEFAAVTIALHQCLSDRLPGLENQWAALLDSQYEEEDESDD
ncbi:MAG: hypothetical protein ACYCSS_01015 [Sulfuriferula sp.]